MKVQQPSDPYNWFKKYFAVCKDISEGPHCTFISQPVWKVYKGIFQQYKAVTDQITLTPFNTNVITYKAT